MSPPTRKRLERRIRCRRQGYETIAPPLIRHDESMLVREDVNLGLHASMVVGRAVPEGRRAAIRDT